MGLYHKDCSEIALIVFEGYGHQLNCERTINIIKHGESANSLVILECFECLCMKSAI